MRVAFYIKNTDEAKHLYSVLDVAGTKINAMACDSRNLHLETTKLLQHTCVMSFLNQNSLTLLVISLDLQLLPRELLSFSETSLVMFPACHWHNLTSIGHLSTERTAFFDSPFSYSALLGSRDIRFESKPCCQCSFKFIIWIKFHVHIAYTHFPDAIPRGGSFLKPFNKLAVRVRITCNNVLRFLFEKITIKIYFGKFIFEAVQYLTVCVRV